MFSGFQLIAVCNLSVSKMAFKNIIQSFHFHLLGIRLLIYGGIGVRGGQRSGDVNVSYVFFASTHHYAKLSQAMRAPWVDRFLDNEIYCYPLSKKRCRPPLRSPPARRSEGIVTSGRQQRNDLFVAGVRNIINYFTFVCNCSLAWTL